MQERKSEIISKRLRAKGLVGLAGSVGIGVVLAACGGSSVNSDSENPIEPTRISEVGGGTAVAPEKPTGNQNVEPTAIAEIKPKSPSELLDFGLAALEKYPKDSDVINIKLSLEDGLENFNIIKSGDERFSPEIVPGAYGEAALRIGQLACDNPDDYTLGTLWFEIRRFVEEFTNEHLGPEYWEVYLENYYAVPSDCPNPVLTQLSLGSS